ncbi:SusD/RagB family nutrient-binding outer membrane lipoprotein [Pedobacter sp. BS3]|uniref:SusD/RagB family nutrient-binding outer membrane lipoprotein n=1 Tax=Pedobacter sp. BS3 TaxID=2567937 RepID=UPI0011EF2969|nr:SusD/RagB family nutrient-binding outer membrane lipoprotein [Pedobacter sp. BS3]TZF83799.1 SusD/RagB family nutrient-binding outer membrane lipoprotein [Pedobacter sp. BS3]
MMRIRKILLLTGSSVLLLLFSCTKNYQQLNENPNAVSVAAPERLLNPALYAMVQTNVAKSWQINNQLTQVFVPLNEQVEIHKYIIRPNLSDPIWNAWYLEKTNFLDMYNLAVASHSAVTGQSEPYMAIANILDAWASSLITDTWGDVPYSQANKGKENRFTPVFDKQEDIYKDIFRKLEEANTLLTGLVTAQLLTDNQKSLDALYGSSATNVIELDRWRKFGNSLYLRLLMRVSARTEAVIDGKTAVQKIGEIVASPTTYPIFTSNAESAILRLTGEDFPLRSPFAGYRDVDFSGTGSLSEFFINTLSETGDPRLPLWATKVDNEYKGIQSGYADGNIPARGSTYVSALKLEPLLGNIMNYAELQFILAEAALKGYIPGDPKTYYNAGVQAGIEHWGLIMPANYLTTGEIMWPVTGTEDQKMEQIMTQKYFTLFFTDFQQWFEYRRTKRPTLPIGPGVKNDGIMPTRLYYPVTVQSLNRSNYQEAAARMGGDDLKAKVWWQVE